MPGAGHGQLHDFLGEVGHRVLHGLVLGGDLQGSGVVVGAVVQPADPAGNGVRQLRHRGGAVRAEDQLRRFHLHLEAEPAGGQRVDLLQPGHGVVHGLHLGHGGDLGQGQDQALGQFAGGGQAGDEQVQGAQAAGPGGRPRST